MPTIMHLIYEICSTAYKIHTTKKWRFLKRLKLNKELDSYMYEFLDINVFDLSNGVLTVLNSLKKTIKNNIDIGVIFDDKYLSMNISDCAVEYLPLSNRFEITSLDIKYTVYRNTKCGSFILEKWNPMQELIKEKYFDILIDVSKYI